MDGLSKVSSRLEGARVRLPVILTVAAILMWGCGTPRQAPSVQSTVHTTNGVTQTTPPGADLPRPDHIVIVVEENHSRSEIIGNPDAPYINALRNEGAYFSNSHAIEHPSQPNYLDLFSGSNQGVTSDACPRRLSAPNLASELRDAHLTFAGYAEDLPSVGYTGCNNGHVFSLGATYVRKHCPWVTFTNVPPSANLPFSQFPTDFTRLPTVSFVIPNLNHDMHNGTVKSADIWLKNNIQPYVDWAKTHNSLLILTWDEDDQSEQNTIPTIFVGPMVKPGTYSGYINHFNVLRTVEDMYGLPHLGESAHVSPIPDVWQKNA